MFAPIGFDLSFPYAEKSGSYGFFLSLLDFGNFISIRGDENVGKDDEDGDAEAKNDTEITIDQIISIGLYFHSSIWNTTGVVWGFGASHSPKMRKVSYTNNDKEPDYMASTRFSIFIAMDIPLFPLFR